MYSRVSDMTVINKNKIIGRHTGSLPFALNRESLKTESFLPVHEQPGNSAHGQLESSNNFPSFAEKKRKKTYPDSDGERGQSYGSSRNKCVQLRANPKNEIIVLDSVTSTNDLAKEILLGKDRFSSLNNDEKIIVPDIDRPFVIISNEQTKGRGRFGRSFQSPAGGGIYMTFVHKLRQPVEEVLFLTMISAVAVCRAIETACGEQVERPLIKWVNDIYMRKLKVCGILTEGASGDKGNGIKWILTGIGVNCFPGAITHELDGIAGSIAEADAAFSREDLTADIITNLSELLPDPDPSVLHEYRDRCIITGKRILVSHLRANSDSRPARALDITCDGDLLVEYDDGSREALRTGEVRLGLDL